MPFIAGRTLPLVFVALYLLTGDSPTVRADGPRWEVQFFHDVDNSELTINDLAFPSPERGVATGVLMEKGDPKPTLIVTSDGGKKWNFVPVQEPPVSIFFLNDSRGWMVTDRGIWQTDESGLSWRKVANLRGMLRVYFLDDKHGFAVGAKKSIHETVDGGSRWTKVNITDQIASEADHTTFNWIEFANQAHGSIAGWSRPPRKQDSEFPDWMDPERAQWRKQWPTSTIVVQTTDGGKTWKPSVTSMFGRISRLRMKGGRGLTLVEFQDAFEYLSEVFSFDLARDKTERVFREKDRAVTDVALTGNAAYLCGVQTAGKLQRSPIPGRLFVLTSKDLMKWSSMEVDYRAYARRAILAAPDEENMWVATDTGMILKLVTP
jgi:hypothetical protein